MTSTEDQINDDDLNENYYSVLNISKDVCIFCIIKFIKINQLIYSKKHKRQQIKISYKRIIG